MPPLYTHLFPIFFASFLLTTALLPPPATPLSFNMTTFARTQTKTCPQDINLVCLQGGASADNEGVIQLTTTVFANIRTDSVGRAVYAMPLLLWDNATRELTNFTTNFSFAVGQDSAIAGYGLAFFLAPYPSTFLSDAMDGLIGLTTDASKFNASGNGSFVAVEFDSYMDAGWDPSAGHVGIDVNSVKSVAHAKISGGFNDQYTGIARVAYNAVTQNLSVSLAYNGASYAVSHVVDLRRVLPSRVSVGFSAATSNDIQLHTVRSWSFESSLFDPLEDQRRKNDTLLVQQPTAQGGGNSGKSTSGGLVAGIAAAAGLLLAGGALVWFLLWRRKRAEDAESEFEEDDDASIDKEFESDKGPRRFLYKELVAATEHFSEERKLGVGGFGTVYRGRLAMADQSELVVAIKRVSKDSKQGKKEYVAEVKIISRLRHRNLVQLIGWCHGRGELLLVYELVPNGSLDSHLFRLDDRVLPWEDRFRVALGLASALLYLHEEWEQCVVHRDIKSSNVMLDASFNAKLGDFGLARLVDHGSGLQTTFLAGTMGYLAPECFITGKGSKDSDVYSFGIVALEIACGRVPVDNSEEIGKVRLVEWVWALYGSGTILEAADKRLETKFDVGQMERLMVVGLWCSHPDYNCRPSVRQALAVLNSEAAVPELPRKMPVPTFTAPPTSLNTAATSQVSDTSTFTTTASSTVTSSPAISSAATLLPHAR